MIKNGRQYRITRAQAEKFAQALAGIEHAGPKPGVRPLMQRAETEALGGQLETLQDEVAAYEDPRSGKERVFISHSFDGLPEALIKARTAACRAAPSHVLINPS